MDKESKSSADQICDSKEQRRQREEPTEPQTPSSPVVLPNPYLSSQSSTRDRVGLNLKENPSRANGGPGGRGGGSGGGGAPSWGHGYSRSRRVRQSTDAHQHSDRAAQNPQDKSSSSINDSSLGRNMGNNCLDGPKRGFRGTKSAPNSAGRSKSPQTIPFEVKMSDFPELAVSPSKPATSPHQKGCWGPTPSLSPRIQKSVTTCEVKSLKSETLPAKRGSPTQPSCHQSASGANANSHVPNSHVVPAGQSSQASSSGGSLTSWANVASQPPKVPVPKEKTSSSSHLRDDSSAKQEEGLSGKKKRKKKKKKAKSEDEEADLEEPAIYQEPPKFEDEEEFPGLTPALPASDRLITSKHTAKLCNEENQRESVQHQSPAAKPLSTETTKKAQKAEKASGKKSKVPVQLDIGNMLAVLEKKQQSQKTKLDTKPVVLSVGGARPVGHKPLPGQKKPPWQQDKIAHNPLDSTSPLVKKGKQREVPKAKKPTPLKKVILKEREERKHRRLLEERGLLPENESEPANEPGEEEECDTAATDDVTSPIDGLEDQPENDTNEMQSKEGGETAQEDDEGEQQATLPVPIATSRPSIHSRKFRDYCSQMLSKDVDECVTSLLKELVRFQDRLYQKDPMKARMKKRIVMGLREVLKHLKLRKVKCVVISPNCERIQSKGGLDEALRTIIDTCREQGVPFVFALSRKALGRCVNKAVPVSLVGIFNYDGAQDYYHKMIELSSEARRAYEVMVSSAEQSETEAEQEADLRELQLSSLSLAEEPEAGPDTTLPGEPEYIQIWKNMLEKESNHTFLNFEEQLSFIHLANDCTDLTDEVESS
ncbi:selenocysteine insertion sequence-binding protein 2-like [Genypterus blacodes]|uniref:selenocysteine insertion sequence-binding protein 2-like n=1 Tax=Genypterus blacodes TaxID=154954 RepID=UPI003F76C6F6